ncbi:MAG: hypothetical protein JO334_11205 [Verrucomicrobia bacterium]|nr:hypothetical protein [Verrucomicrobiota bacterium]
MKLKRKWLCLFPLACFAFEQPARADTGLLGMELAAAQTRTDFFRFFHLEPVGSAETRDKHAIRHFRPSGPKFHDLVQLEVETDSDDRILRLTLQLDRSFIDSSSTGVFGADLAKSFLLDAGGGSERDALWPITNEIQFRDLARPILMHRAAAPELSHLTSSGYLAYRGRRTLWTFSTSEVTFTMRNADLDGKPVLFIEAEALGKSG